MPSCKLETVAMPCIRQNETYKNEGIAVRDTESPPYDYSTGAGVTAKMQIRTVPPADLNEKGELILTIEWDATSSTITRQDTSTQVGPPLVYTYTDPVTMITYNAADGAIYFPFYFDPTTTEGLAPGQYVSDLRIVPDTGEPFYALIATWTVEYNETEP